MTQPALEKSPRSSPLLSDAVIERDYTQGIESQISGSGPAPTSNQYQPPEQSAPKQDQRQGQPAGPPPGAGQQHQFDAPGDFESPKGFSFEEEFEGDPSDAQDGEEPGFELASASAKTFANVIGDIIKTKVPEMSYGFCKIDMGSIETHIANGNINPNLRDPFIRVNENTREGLEFSDDEIKMWKKAFKEYLEYKNIKGANPETAFWIATATLVVTQGIKVTQMKKENKKLIVMAINNYNPEYFESYKAKQGDAPEEKVSKAEPSQKKTEKTAV